MKNNNLQTHISKAYKKVYKSKSPKLNKVQKQADSRPNTFAVLGVQLGDEGKGRIVDNKIKTLLNKKSINKVYVIRSQGGNNAGHTVEKGDARIGLHQLPSGIFFEESIEVLDSGMVIHVRDLLDEITLAQEVAGKLSDRIILSEDAMLCTDLDRAKEVLNRKINGNAKGGTGRGIGPTSAAFYDKTGSTVDDLVSKEWEKTFSKKYDQYNKLFKAYNENLAKAIVPDFINSKRQKADITKSLGSKKVFLERLEQDRKELLKLGIVKDTFYLHSEIDLDKNAGIMFEMAQAVGLDPYFGTRPDRTSTITTAYGIQAGTRYWKPSQISEIVGIMKATYMSSVGARTMPTEVNNDWAKWVRDIAHEYGTTTGRPRDICHLDLPFLMYNISMSGITSLGITHLDISQSKDPIKVCVGYKKNGKDIEYKPDMYDFLDFEPIYLELPSWDVEEVAGINKFEKLPLAAKQYLMFIQEVTGLPITAATTGPHRKDSIIF